MTITAQETFDRVATHLLTQKAYSVDPERGCAYRDPEGRKCAVGCLIPDDKYFPDLEQKLVSHSAVIHLLCTLGYYDHISLLADLQRVHDTVNVSSWLGHLCAVAINHSLSPDILDKFHE